MDLIAIAISAVNFIILTVVLAKTSNLQQQITEMKKSQERKFDKRRNNQSSRPSAQGDNSRRTQRNNRSGSRRNGPRGRQNNKPRPNQDRNQENKPEKTEVEQSLRDINLRLKESEKSQKASAPKSDTHQGSDKKNTEKNTPVPATTNEREKKPAPAEPKQAPKSVAEKPQKPPVAPVETQQAPKQQQEEPTFGRR